MKPFLGWNIPRLAASAAAARRMTTRAAAAPAALYVSPMSKFSLNAVIDVTTEIP